MCVLTFVSNENDARCRPILHRFANEDVSLGAWLLGLEVEHVDDRSLCCATPPGTYEFRGMSRSSLCSFLLHM